MKKITAILAAALLCTAAYAGTTEIQPLEDAPEAAMQIRIGKSDKAVATFLGIPIDGKKKEFRKKLERLGFEYHKPQRHAVNRRDYLTGVYNGKTVYVHIITEKGRVWRVVAIEQDCYSAEMVKDRFNTVCQSIEEDTKYAPAWISYKQWQILEQYGRKPTSQAIPERKGVSLMNHHAISADWYQEPDTSVVPEVQFELYGSEEAQYNTLMQYYGMKTMSLRVMFTKIPYFDDRMFSVAYFFTNWWNVPETEI